MSIAQMGNEVGAEIHGDQEQAPPVAPALPGKQNRAQNREQELENRRERWKKDHDQAIRGLRELGYEDEEEFLATQSFEAESSAAESRLVGLQRTLLSLREEWIALWPEDFVVGEMNKRHAVVHINQFSILTEKKDSTLKADTHVLESKQSLKDTYENKRITCSDGKERTWAEIWLKDEKRRTYPNGLTFNPKTGRDVNGAYNVWKGFAVVAQQGDCHLFWEFVRDVICAGNENTYNYVRKWLAYLIQHPDEIHTALVLCGGEGIGKGTFVEAIGALFGIHYVPLSSLHELTSNFNEHLKHAVLIYANEAIWGGNKKDLGTIKAMVTDKECTVEAKGQDRIRFKNFRHIIFSSNEDWPIHIDPDDRRFCVLNVSRTHKEDLEYFGKILAELKAGGKEALLYDLLHEPLDKFIPQIIPNTESSFEIKMLGAHQVERYAFEVLKAECFDVGNTTPVTPWPLTLSVSKDQLYSDFRTWCENAGERPIGKEQFIAKLKKILPSIEATRPTGPEGKRIRSLSIPTIEKARKEFQKYFKTNTSNIWND